MTLRNPTMMLPDFTDLNGCVLRAPNVSPSDIDMVLERNGKFLVAEWKRPYESLSKGQEIMLKKLATKPGFAVLIVRGHADPGKPMVIDSIHMLTSTGDLIKSGSSLEDLRRLINRWYEWADYEEVSS